ncbi:MAG: hypothetical protein JWO08_875 [Verrucomicrobiaceae bacterium]|nr:hypothetical protein [Verrucomicrobiaceae bacterium]
MKALFRRAWDAFLPIPNVDQFEAFLTRAFLAAILHRFLPQEAMDAVAQPKPVGLAHLMDLTWLSQPQPYAIFHFVFLVIAFLYASGIVLQMTLPVLTLLHLLPYTLLNSQASPHHGYQIISLALVGMSVVAVAQGLSGKGQPWPSLKHLLITVILAVVTTVLFDRFMMMRGAGETIAQWIGAMFGAQGPSYVFSLLRIVVFTLLAKALTEYAMKDEKRCLPSPLLNAYLLIAAQFMIGGAYLVSVCSKMQMSKGQWLVNSHYVALDFVKTMRQSYYSALDPKFAQDPASVLFLMSHENLARLFFGGGVLLETVLILAVGTRWLALFFGIALLVMHSTIEELMTLTFPTNQYMDTLFYINVPFLIALAVAKGDDRKALLTRHSIP